MSKNSCSLERQALSIGEKSLPFFIVAIHFSTFITLILSILIALLWLVSGSIKDTNRIAKQIPATIYALLLLGALTLSVTYSAAPLFKALATLSKYRTLLLPLILIALLTSEQQRNYCEKFLLTSLIAALIFSFADYFNLLPHDFVDHFLKSRITHSIFMAFLGFFCLHRLYENQQHKALWAIILILVGLNLFLTTDGRTGQLIFLLLAVLFFLQVFSFRTALILGIATLTAFVVFLFFSPHAGRFFEGINESINFYHNASSVEETSMGLRLGFWRDTLTIIWQSPWFGEGIGGLPYRVQQIFPGRSSLVNPHNEYLLITSQLGIPGLLLFLAFLVSILRRVTCLPQTQRWLLQGVWLALLISCIFNSSIFDHTEGHWFMTLIALYSAPLITSQTCLASLSSPKTNPNI
jgi:O-antigen ligase